MKATKQERYLFIWIAHAEAYAIAIELQGTSSPRPLTHDLLRSIIDTLGAQVTHIIVNDLSNDTYYARIMLEVNGGPMEIDSRPSDAIALAVRAKVPIFADESVLAKAGVMLDKDGESAAGVEQTAKAIDPAELERMSAFKDFIESLDLDDFDKRKS